MVIKQTVGQKNFTRRETRDAREQSRFKTLGRDKMAGRNIGSGKTMQAAVNNARTKLHNKAERAALKRKQAEQLLAEAEQLSKEAA